MEHLLGTSVKGYELLELIGTGGFGAVYRAKQVSVGREVAVKVILPEFANTPMFIRRFETEAQLVARLEHPYIVPLHDYWRDPKGAYLVMRYLRGGNLTKQIARHGPLTLDRAGVMLSQIAAALAVAHANGVIHRDLKPDNILLDEAGNYYLSDFGIAKDIGTDVNLTQTGTIIGSPAYLSPEQITGESITPLSDVYALGILLHFALTGEHPFPGKTPTAMLVHQMQDPLPPLHATREDVSDAIEEVLQRATAKDPQSRFESVMELAIAFNRALRSPTASTSAVQRLTSAEASMLIGNVDPTNIPNPYKGLNAFEEADANQFYGRSDLTETLLNRLSAEGSDDDGDHLLVLVGPSGSGKSSVVKAGLLPALRRGALPGSASWFYADMVPGAHPMEEMEAALLRVAINPPPSLLSQLQDDERGLVRAIKRVLPDDGSQLVLFIDQFEEVFTLTENERERQHFLNSLMTTVTEPRNRLRLILTLRADFYDRPLSYHAFGELVRQYTEVVLPLSPQQLERAIVEPAKQVGISLETGLASAIVGDVRNQPGALPLMQYALTQLFEQREGDKLTLAAYNEIGRAMGALAQRAETLYGGLNHAEQNAAEQLFLRLVTLGEGTEDTRRRVLRSELQSLDAPQVMERVIGVFGEQRLLMFDNDPQTREPTIEVAHEALIREWRRYGDWLDYAREDLRTQRRLFQATQEWLAAERDASYLARGSLLDQFAALRESNNVAVNETEAAYLEASLQTRQEREREEKERIAREQALEEAARQRLQWLVGVMSVAAVLAVLLALVAFQAQRSAVAAQSESEAAAVIALENEQRAAAVAQAANALTLVDNFRPTLALNLALEAAANRPEITSVQRALASAAYAPSAVAQLNPSFEQASFVDVAFATQTDRLAVGTSDGRLLLFDTTTKDIQLDLEATGSNDEGPASAVLAVAISPDGSTIVTGDANGMLTIWDAATGQAQQQIEAHEAGIAALAYDPSGGRVVSAGADAAVYLWDANTGEQLRAYDGHVGQVFAVDWAANADRIVTSTGDHPDNSDQPNRRVRVFDVETGEMILDFAEAGTGWFRASAISDDGQQIAVASYDTNEFGGTIRVVEVASGEVLRRLYGHTDVITTIDISPDGSRLLSGGWDRTLREWDLTSGAQLQRFDTHNDRLLTVRYTPDGRSALATAGRTSGPPDDGRALYYSLETLARVHTLRGHTDWLWGVAYNPDGSLIATGSGDLNTAEGDNSVRVWDAETGQELARLEGHQDTVPGVAFHPEGDLLASGSWDGTIRLWGLSDFPNVTELETLTGHEGAVNDIDFGPQGDILLSAGSDGSVRLWNLTNREVIRTIDPAHDGRVLRAKISADGQLVATSGTDSLVRVWNIRTGEEIRTLAGHTGWVSTVNFSSDGRFVVSGADNDLIVWDLEAPEGEEIYRVLVGHEGFVYGGDFSPDDKYIISGASDTSVRLWEVATGDEIQRFDNHINWVLDVEFHPDGTRAVSVAEDNTAMTWRIALSTEGLMAWARDNRYLPELTCAQRERYNVQPLCDLLGDSGEGRGREDRGVATDD